MGNRTTIDALFTFTNESLLHKKTTMPGVIGSFEAYISSLSIPSEEIDDVMSTLSSVEVGDYLPAERSDPVPTRRRRQPARARADGDDDDDGDEEMSDGDGDADGSSLDEEEGEDSDADTDEDEDEGDYVYIKTAEVPDGFEKVVVAEPAAYIPDSALDGHFIMLFCDDLEWMLGKIEKMNKPTAKLQLNVQWKAGDVAGQQAKLSDYFKPESGETPHAGNWFYVRSSRAATTESRRRSRGGEGEAESKGAGDDDDFGDDGDDI